MERSNHGFQRDGGLGKVRTSGSRYVVPRFPDHPAYHWHPDFDDAGASVRFDPAKIPTPQVAERCEAGDEVLRQAIKTVHYCADCIDNATSEEERDIWKARHRTSLQSALLLMRKLIYYIAKKNVFGFDSFEDACSIAFIVASDRFGTLDPWAAMAVSTIMFAALSTSVRKQWPKSDDAKEVNVEEIAGFFPDKETTSIAEECVAIDKLLSSDDRTLTGKEKDFVKRFYGIGVDMPENLREIAAEYGCSYQHVADVLTKALAKMRECVKE